MESEVSRAAVLVEATLAHGLLLSFGSGFVSFEREQIFRVFDEVGETGLLAYPTPVGGVVSKEHYHLDVGLEPLSRGSSLQFCKRRASGCPYFKCLARRPLQTASVCGWYTPYQGCSPAPNHVRHAYSDLTAVHL